MEIDFKGKKISQVIRDIKSGKGIQGKKGCLITEFNWKCIGCGALGKCKIKDFSGQQFDELLKKFSCEFIDSDDEFDEPCEELIYKIDGKKYKSELVKAMFNTLLYYSDIDYELRRIEDYWFVSSSTLLCGLPGGKCWCQKYLPKVKIVLELNSIFRVLL